MRGGRRVLPLLSLSPDHPHLSLFFLSHSIPLPTPKNNCYLNHRSISNHNIWANISISSEDVTKPNLSAEEIEPFNEKKLGFPLTFSDFFQKSDITFFVNKASQMYIEGESQNLKNICGYVKIQVYS